MIHRCEREGDLDELVDQAIENGFYFLIRICENRMTVENQKTLDEIRQKKGEGRHKVPIPRDTRRKLKERDVILQIRYATFEIKKPQIKNKDKNLPPSLLVNIRYVAEENPPEGVEPIEWFLMTNEAVTSVEDAYEKVAYYIRRWKIERFHYVLKSGCKIEELQERSMEKMKTLILRYSVIGVFIMHLTYLGRVYPDLPCSVLFDEDEWKLLYCLAKRTKEVPQKAYTIKEAVDNIITLREIVPVFSASTG
jgi:hypothetical protein